MESFEVGFRKAPIEEQKMRVKEIISEIMVGRDSNTVKFDAHKGSALTPCLEDFYKEKGTPRSWEYPK